MRKKCIKGCAQIKRHTHYFVPRALAGNYYSNKLKGRERVSYIVRLYTLYPAERESHPQVHLLSLLYSWQIARANLGYERVAQAARNCTACFARLKRLARICQPTHIYTLDSVCTKVNLRAIGVAGSFESALCGSRCDSALRCLRISAPLCG